MCFQVNKAFSLIKKGRNVILYGPGGCGKSYAIRRLYHKLVDNGYCTYTTALTGIAAFTLSNDEPKIPCSTLHSYAGIGIGFGTVEELYQKVSKYKGVISRIRNTDVLIIDEISMLGANLFSKLSMLFSAIRKDDRIFGGITLVMSGDFLQLPPVKENFVFECETYKDLKLHPVIFDEPKRFNNLEHYERLLRVRKNQVLPEDIEFFKSRHTFYKNKKWEENEIRPTTIFPKRDDVDYYNKKELEKLETDLYTFTAEDSFKGKKNRDVPNIHPKKKEWYHTNMEDAIPSIINLKVGAQITLKKNLDIDRGLVNGSRGIIIDMKDSKGSQGWISCKFVATKDEIIDVNRENWEYEDEDVIVVRNQYPLILGYAITIHKSQGMTLDCAVCDMGASNFCPGQVYVAISRVRTAEGLYVSDFSPSCFIVDESAMKHDSTIKESPFNYSLKIKKKLELSEFAKSEIAKGISPNLDVRLLF